MTLAQFFGQFTVEQYLRFIIGSMIATMQIAYGVLRYFVGEGEEKGDKSSLAFGLYTGIGTLLMMVWIP